MSTPNWDGLHAPRTMVNGKQTTVPQNGIKPKYFGGGTWHADRSKDGKSRKAHKTS